MSTPPVLLEDVIKTRSLRIFLSFYKYVGLWPPSSGESFRRSLYFLWTFLLHFNCTFIYICTMVVNIVVRQDIGDLYITLTEFGMLGKVIPFLKRHVQFQEFLQDLFTNPLLAVRDSQEKQLYRDNLRHYQRIINVYISSCLMVIVSAGLSSIFSDPIRIPYPAWFPVDYSARGLSYYIIFTYQNFGMTMHACMNLIWDCLMPFFMVNLHVQFLILGHRLRAGFSEPKNPLKTRQELIGFVKQYNGLVKLNHDVQNIMSLPIAFQISITGFVLCVTMIQLISVSPLQNFTLFMLYVSYIICMLIQVYLQCYFGSRAIHGSVDLATAAYASNWLDVDIANRKFLTMFMIRLREPCKIKTMRIFVMDLSTFTSILNMSYSLFAVLRNTKRGKY